MEKVIEQIRILNETLSKDFNIDSDIKIENDKISVRIKIDNLPR